MIALALTAWASAAFGQQPTPPARHQTLPAVSPDGQRVVYVSERDGGATELYVADLATGLERRLTYSGANKGAPQWTQGGSRIAYVVARGDTSELLTLAPDGSGARKVLTRVAKNLCLSPDGRRLACTVGTWTRNRIRVSDADGGHARAVTDSSAGFFSLAWSPDARRLAVTHRDSTGALQIWLVDPEAAAKPRELVRLSVEEGQPQWPAWSPDGQRIAFQAGEYLREEPARSDSHVCVVEVATGKVTKLRTHPKPMLDETPSWQDDDHIVFQSTQTGAFELWVMKADGSGARRVAK